MNISRKIFSVALASLLSAIILCTFGCNGVHASRANITPSGNTATKTIDIPGTFHKIIAGSIVTVRYSKGPKKVTVTAPQNIIRYVEVFNNSGTLCATFESDVNISGRLEIVVNVTAPYIDKITTQGTASVIVDGDLMTRGDLTLTSGGTGNIIVSGLTDVKSKLSIYCQNVGAVILGDVRAKDADIYCKSVGGATIDNVTADNISVFNHGVGQIELRKGNVKSASLVCTSVGNINAPGLKSESMTACADGIGNVTCMAAPDFKIQDSGNGKVIYTGTPKRLIDNRLENRRCRTVQTERRNRSERTERQQSRTGRLEQP